MRTVDQRRAFWMKTQKAGIAIAGGVGVTGVIAIIAGIQGSTLSWSSLSIGQKIGFFLYGGLVGAGVVLWAISTIMVNRIDRRRAVGPN